MCSFPALLSLCEYQATRKKSLVKITSDNCRRVEIYTMDKLVRVLRNFGVVVSNPNRPFYVLLILFPRLCQSVHSIRNCNQCCHRWPCKQHLCTARRGVCPLVSGNMYAKHWEVCNPLWHGCYVVLAKFSQRCLWHMGEQRKVTLTTCWRWKSCWYSNRGGMSCSRTCNLTRGWSDWLVTKHWSQFDTNFKSFP